MRYISTFSGIEAASVAWGQLGWEPVCFSEVDPFPSAVLSYRYPEVVNLGDITEVDWIEVKREHGPADLVAWCNQPGLFKKMDFGEFLDKRHPRNQRRGGCRSRSGTATRSGARRAGVRRRDCLKTLMGTAFAANASLDEEKED